MGVITTCRLPEGTTFGPVPPSVTLADPIVLIGHRTSDTPSDIHTVKLDLASFSSGVMHLIEWVPYVQAARDPQEQNMEATIDDDDHQLYFRVTRTVLANGELLIWYSDKLAARIGVPEIREDCIRGDVYYCPSCHESFVYPNCLRAHLRFRCKYRQQQLITGSTVVTPNPPAIQSSYGLSPTSGLTNFREAAIALETASFARQRASSPLSREDRRTTSSRLTSDGRSQKCGRTVPDERSSQTPDDDSTSVGTNVEKRNSARGGSGSRRRRHHDESASSADERNAPSPTRYPRSKITRRSSRSPLTCKDGEEDISFDGTNDDDDDDDDDASGSAFRHVTRDSPTTSSSGAAGARCGSVGSESLAASSAATPPPRQFAADLSSSSASLMNSALALPGSDKASAVAAAAAAMMGGVFLFPQIAAARAAAAAAAAVRAAGVGLPLGMQQQHHHHERLRAAAAAQLPVGFAPTSIHDSAASLFYHNLNNNNNHIVKNSFNSKFPAIPGVFAPNYEIPAQPQTNNRPIPSSQNPLPFAYRNPNPMIVDKMLQMMSPPQSHAPPTMTTVPNPPVHHHTQQQQQQQQQHNNHHQSARLPTSSPGVSGPLQSTLMSLNLSQNWCAKCNTSFRMTSDLVYHMRSHHKRDFDPVKRRKDDKLRCDVCGETFRERHHLTRHMTSHS